MEAESNLQNNKAESTEPKQLGFEPSALNFKLKIGYDGKRAANNLTGLGNYSRSLIEALSNQFPNNQYLVYTPKVKKARQIDSFFQKENINLKLPRNGNFLWRTLNILKDLFQDNVQIFHGLSHEIPYGIKYTPIKSIVTIHDLIFLRFPHYYKFIDRKLYEWKSRAACRNANKIIAISEKTRTDIVELYGIDPKKIEVIYQSCDESFKTPFSNSELERVKSDYQLPDNYILNVGTIESRKNLKLLIQALPEVNGDYKLVVLGKQTPYFKDVEKEIELLGLSDRIVFLQNIPFLDLPGIYQLANLFVYPSFYEGFGIPIIEALYSNTPVIAATGSCLEEAGGPDSIYIDPTNPAALAESINMVLNSTSLQNKMKEKGLEFVQKFSSPLVTQELMNCYLSLLE